MPIMTTLYLKDKQTMFNGKKIRSIGFIVFLFALISPFLATEDTRVTSEARYLEKAYPAVDARDTAKRVTVSDTMIEFIIH